MDIEAATMKVDYLAARTAYEAYRAAVKEKRATKDDETLFRAYRAMMRGRAVVDVGLAIANAGYELYENRALPKLAIGRADWDFVHCSRPRTHFRFSSRQGNWGRRPKGEVDVLMPAAPNINGDGKAQLPLIPPQHRPGGDLSRYHILFEATWQRTPPDPDPLLLERIGTDGLLFVVLAAWDLTPLEQAVLRARL
jgi:hypothetical protein